MNPSLCLAMGKWLNIWTRFSPVGYFNILEASWGCSVECVGCQLTVLYYHFVINPSSQLEHTPKLLPGISPLFSIPLHLQTFTACFDLAVMMKFSYKRLPNFEIDLSHATVYVTPLHKQPANFTKSI